MMRYTLLTINGFVHYGYIVGLFMGQRAGFGLKGVEKFRSSFEN